MSLRVQGGLDFFCTTLEFPDGNVELLRMSMDAMNAEPDPDAEDRKGCSGRVGKMIFSAGTEQLALVAYVPEALAEKVSIGEWFLHVCAKVGAEIATELLPAVEYGRLLECQLECERQLSPASRAAETCVVSASAW